MHKVTEVVFASHILYIIFKPMQIKNNGVATLSKSNQTVRIILTLNYENII